MQGRGRSAHAEQLVLYKRTSLAVAVPFMVLLGWPLGVRWRRPGPMAVATVLLLWGAQRMGDHAAVMCGAAVSAGLPVVFLALLTGMIWWSWAER
jgi:lipopolysaccharide export LptBFGC system permease protein LptF